MNAAFLVLTAWVAAGDGVPVAPQAAPPIVHAAPAAIPSATPCSGGGCGTVGSCGGCGVSCCDPCCERESFFSRLRGRIGGIRERIGGLFRRGGDCCDPCCTPSCCDSCAHGGVINGGCGTAVGTPVLAPAPLPMAHPGAMPGTILNKVEPVPPPKSDTKPADKLPEGKPKSDAPKTGSDVKTLAPTKVGTPVLSLTPTSGKSPF